MVEGDFKQEDRIARTLRRYAQNILVVVFGLLPLLFVPNVSAPFEYTKVIIVVVAVFLVLVLYSLSVLRTGVIRVGISYPLCALWAIAGISFLSSLLSGDFKDSLVGDLFSIHSTAFVAVLALVPTVWMFLRTEKMAVVHMYLLIAVSTFVLVAFHVLRLFFGPDFLSFGIFTGTVSTPVGSWNDLALFLGLTVILSLIALEQLSLTKVGRLVFAGVSVASLVMLGVINFFTVWIVLGLTSLVMIVYSLGKGRFSPDQLPLVTSNATSTVPLTVSLLVFVASVLFVVGGSTFGGLISKYTGTSYVEVRPSLEATADIARSVYHENAFLGIGANKFTDAWRLYKDNSINVTPFWNTDFNAGSGYITTFFVTTGVLGGVAWMVFLVMYVVIGVRRLLFSPRGDTMWYFIGVSSFVTAIYIWGMSTIYVPGVVILLLGALCTGVSLAAMNMIGGVTPREITLGSNHRTGFILTLSVIAIIIGSVSVLYLTGRHYSSVYIFNESIVQARQGVSIEDIERQVESAYQLSPSDVYARRIAEYQLAKMNTLVARTEPTVEEQTQFQNARIMGVNAAQQAIQIDPQEPANWSILGGVYSILASVGVEGAQERALEALAKSRELNPKNPLPYLESAVVESRVGNFESARNYIRDSITLKSNFTEAFFLLSQLEIAAGNVEGAIQSTQAVITLEPQNPAQYYQLGVLESANKNLEGAVMALERAVELDQSYANARYVLALAYDELGRSADARKQLEVVLDLNPGNVEITKLLDVLKREGSLKSLRNNAQSVVSEALPVTNENGTVSTTQSTDTTLVNPVNTAPKVETAKTVPEAE